MRDSREKLPTNYKGRGGEEVEKTDNSSQHIQLNRRAGPWDILTEVTLESKVELGQADFSIYPSLLPRTFLRQLPPALNRHFNFFPIFHGRQHELQYFRADKRKTCMQVLLSTRGLHIRTERLEWIPFQKLSFSFSSRDWLVCSQ